LYETVNRVFEFKLTVDIEERCVVMVTICLLVIGFSLHRVKLPNILKSALMPRLTNLCAFLSKSSSVLQDLDFNYNL